MELKYLSEAIWQIINSQGAWLVCVEPLWETLDRAHLSQNSSKVAINIMGSSGPSVSIVQHGLWIYHLYLPLIHND